MPDQTTLMPPPTSDVPPAPVRKTRARAPARAKAPTAAELAKLTSIRKQLAATKQEVSDAIEESREAESRLSAARMEAEAVRRILSDLDKGAAATRGAAESSLMAVERSRKQIEELQQYFNGLSAGIETARREYAQLQTESSHTLERFRQAIEEMRRAENGDLPQEQLEDLPDGETAGARENAADLRERLVHLLTAAGTVEKELAGLLQSLADETDDEDVRKLFEAHREAGQQRQQAIARRLEAMDVTLSSGRGFLGQLANRIWEAVQTSRDPADRTLLAVLKGVSATEYLVGLYRAMHAAAEAMNDAESRNMAAAHFRGLRERGKELNRIVAKAAAEKPFR
jgi:ferritin-like metal-binding protein YciE